MKLEFTVYGEAKPAGSKTGFVVKDKRTGKSRAIVVDACKAGKPWHAAVASAAAEAFQGELIRGAVAATFRFYFPRPKCHFGTGRNAGTMKPGAPAFVTKAPDVLKLARNVEDALTKIVYADDAQITQEFLSKHWGEPARCEVKIETLTPNPRGHDERSEGT